MAAFPTSTTVLDSILFRDAFGTPAMREVFCDFSLISRYAEVEIALAKAAIYLAMFDRHAERLEQLKPRVLVGQFAGAAGTLASLGDKGFEVQQALCEELGLGVPVSTWHVARDRLAEVINFFGLVTGSLGKIALDIMIMASTEFGELYEPFVKGRGASSTMPQKRNPISSELMLAAAKG